MCARAFKVQLVFKRQISHFLGLWSHSGKLANVGASIPVEENHRSSCQKYIPYRASSGRAWTTKWGWLASHLQATANSITVFPVTPLRLLTIKCDLITKALMDINRGQWTLSHLLLSSLPRPLHPITVPSGPHPIKFLHMRKRLTLWLYCRSSPSHPSLSRSPSHHSSPSHPSQHPALQVDYRISRDLIIRTFVVHVLAGKVIFIAAG